MPSWHGINCGRLVSFYNAKPIDYAVEKLNIAIAGVNLAALSS
jgi:hypothetical protein